MEERRKLKKKKSSREIDGVPNGGESEFSEVDQGRGKHGSLELTMILVEEVQFSFREVKLTKLNEDTV